MGLDTAQVVETLDAMGLLELDDDGPWETPDPTGDFDACDIAWDEIQVPDQVANPLADSDWEAATVELNERRSGQPFLPPSDVFDVLAWYLPIHFYGPGWGIYIRESAVFDLAASIRSYLPPPRQNHFEVIAGSIRAALGVLFHHEVFHHKVESLATRLEVIEHGKRYAPYTKKVYEKIQRTHPVDLLEEALACAEAYRRPLTEAVYRRGIPADVLRARREMLRRWFGTLPDGYNQASKYTGQAFETARNGLASQVHEAVERPMRRVDEWDLVPHAFHGLFNCLTATWVLVPVGTRPIIPWFSRSPRPLSISTKSLVSALEADGYGIVRGAKGSHLKLRAKGRRTIILPANREALSPRVLSTTAEALGLHSIRDIETFVKAR